MASKADLELLILLYAHQRLLKGHLQECLNLGFDLEALQIIRRLDLAALSRTDSRRRGRLTTRIVLDKQALAELAAELEATGQLETLIEQLLRQDASPALLKHFFGIQRQDYCNRRKLLALPPNRPGPRCPRGIPRPAESRVLRCLAQALARYRPAERLTPRTQCDCLLQVAAETGHALDAIWHLAERQALRGNFAWTLAPPAAAANRQSARSYG